MPRLSGRGTYICINDLDFYYNVAGGDEVQGSAAYEVEPSEYDYADKAW